MLQAPQVSRVCGHGHIKKFWLMQTQRENQTSESVALPSPSSSSPRNVAMGSLIKALDLSRRSNSPTTRQGGGGYGESGIVATGKHSSVSCAESLSPPAQFQQNYGSRVSDEAAYSYSSSSSRSRSISPKLSAEIDTKQRGSELIEDTGRSNVCAGGGGNSCGQSEKETNAAPISVSRRDVQFEEGITSPTDAACLENREKLSGGKFSYVNKKPSVILPDSYRDVLCGSSPRSSDLLQHPSPKACSLCGTTKTPMWRSGPQGPKSLCNACGIRFKKYRSFPGQSEPSELMMHPVGSPRNLARPLKRKQGSVLPTNKPSKPETTDLKSSADDLDSRHQKKSKWYDLIKSDQSELKQKLMRDNTWKLSSGPPSFKKIYGCVLPLHSKFKKLVPMDEHRAASRAFAKEEEEAAVLLMHLSCGLVY